jgi:formylglycine-generating enzyme required for sulfatase activity
MYAVPPTLNYAGQVRVQGKPFSGTGYVKFAFVNASGNVTYWSHDGTSTAGSEPSGYVSVQVRGGLYSLLLGNTAISGMSAIDPSLFQQYSDIHVRVWFNDGERGFQHLHPDRPFSSVPYALSAGSTSVTPDMLSDSIVKYLKPEIVDQPTFTQTIENGIEVQLEPSVEGKYLSYQWYKNGTPIIGATSQLFTIASFDLGYDDGNYTVVVTNEFGSVESEIIELVEPQQSKVHTVYLNSTVKLEMFWVEPGTFTMGSPESEGAGWVGSTHVGTRYTEEQREITLSNGFYLGKYEVTQAQYEAVMKEYTETLSIDDENWISATPSVYWNNPNRPVESVSWDDAQIFLTRLNTQEANNIPPGWAYVLPTEAQWEYACRAGTTTAYSWGDSITSDDANYNENIGETADVGSYSPNPWGFFDMHGNVWEWTSDWYDVTYLTYFFGATTDPEGPATGGFRVTRGGSYSWDGSSLRSASRSGELPSQVDSVGGFRVAFQQIPEDTKNPEFVMSGENDVNHLQDTAWVDPGMEAHDVRDGNLTSDIVVTGSVDVNTTGTYTLTYTVSDAAGNEASITRTVNVVEGQASTHTADLNSTVSLEMIWVEPGTFTMGQNDISDASPEHEVTLSKGFYLGKYEVTQAQYEAVMTGNTDSLSATPSQWPNNPNRPVEKVSWDDAQVFLTRLNAQEAGNIPAGWAYVLPTEAQWEYACRAGTTTAYSWGDSITSTNANYFESGLNQTTDVGQYSANPWGFFDMPGNVWEWTADAWGTYTSGAQTDPFNAGASGSHLVIRGGSWADSGPDLRPAFRYNEGSSYLYSDIGFRVGFQQL